MRLFFYIFLICQLLNFLNVFAQKVKEDSSQINSVKWERVEEKFETFKKIIWRSYSNDESYFVDEILENKDYDLLKKNVKETLERIKSLNRKHKSL